LDLSSSATEPILRGAAARRRERAGHFCFFHARFPPISLFGASNELPQETELEALFDRFLIRMTVGYVSEGGFTMLQQLLANHRARQAPRTITQAELAALQQAVERIPIPGAIIDTIAQLLSIPIC
jgi:MoxR-like ATPase